MENQKAILKKLFRLSLYTSMLLAVVSVIPWLLSITVASNFFYLLLLLIVFTNTFIIWQINILLVYKIHSIKSNNRKSILRYILSFIITITVSGLFIHFVQSFDLFDIYVQDEEFIKFQEQNILAPFFSAFFTNTFVLFIQELLLLREKKAFIELENARLRIENTEAINQQLKQHIQPHFLFNSLSILKSLIHKDPLIAEEYVIRLSDFLRVSVSPNQADLVQLAKELQLCEDYIEMQKIRFGEALQVAIAIPEKTLKKGFVPGFSVQLLIENAIKHNAFTVNTPLTIEVFEKNGWLCVTNNIQPKSSAENNTQSGLSNLSKRYMILSGHDIQIAEQDDRFEVRIKILDHAHSDH